MIRRQWGLIVLDIVMLIVAVALALFLRFEGDMRNVISILHGSTVYPWRCWACYFCCL